MRPPRVTLEERAVPERCWSRDWVLPLARTPALPSMERVVLLERAWLPAPLERLLELLLLTELLLLERVVPLERAALPLERVALLLRRLLSWWLLLIPEERVAEELPLLLERLTEELPLERELLLELEPLELRRLSCCTELLVPAERVLAAPLERTVELLPEELLERELELLPEERELLLCWVVLPPLERRDWPHISGAVSMAKASIREAAIVINLLIALKFLS